MLNEKSGSIYNRLAPWIIPVLLLIGWQLFTMNESVSGSILPPPFEVIRTGISMAISGDLWTHIYISFSRALTGFVIGGGLAILIGMLNGTYPFVEKHLDTTVQMFRNIPHLALIPLIILWFGVGEESKVVLVAIGVFFPIYINTYHGIRSVDKGLVEMGNVYRLSRWHLFSKVILRGALPSILVGIRYALGTMWVTLIVAETIAASSGIGYMSNNAREFMQLDIVVLAILLYAILGKVADSLAKLLEARLLKWSPVYQMKK
ncbi:ABC transporter permease subunit [Oceanobacillus sp. Castelsardo]|uniref:ABC transporter permease subunit n=1 Tax=Oceanobacillus sp. Castelsardo TaxID=1851204 RepID=UPI000838AC2D|nr:ABC transporter permease subunit [Oceanobacillus sp. Castelsardo]